MERRTASRASAGGGDDIPAFREGRLRLASGVVTLALFAGLVAYPATATTRLPAVVGGIAAAAWLLLVVALAGAWSFAIAWALFAFGCEYALFLRLRGGSVDSRALFVAGVLVLVAELAFGTILPTQGTADRTVLLRSFFALLGSTLAAMTVAGVVLVASGSVRSGVAFEALGVFGAAVILAVVVRIAARTRDAARN